MPTEKKFSKLHLFGENFLRCVTAASICDILSFGHFPLNKSQLQSQVKQKVG